MIISIIDDHCVRAVKLKGDSPIAGNPNVGLSIGIRTKGCLSLREDGSHQLREPAAPYNGNLDHENDVLGLENIYSWNDMA